MDEGGEGALSDVPRGVSLPPRRGERGGGEGVPGTCVCVCGGLGQERHSCIPRVCAGEGLLLHDHDRSGTICPSCVCKLVWNELHEQ